MPPNSPPHQPSDFGRTPPLCTRADPARHEHQGLTTGSSKRFQIAQLQPYSYLIYFSSGILTSRYVYKAPRRPHLQPHSWRGEPWHCSLRLHYQLLARGYLEVNSYHTRSSRRLSPPPLHIKLLPYHTRSSFRRLPLHTHRNHGRSTGKKSVQGLQSGLYRR